MNFPHPGKAAAEALEDRLQAGVGAIAEDGGGAVLATAEIDGFGLSGFKFCRPHVRGFMTAVAKRLIGTQSAGTPVVALSGFDLDRVGTFLRDGWFGHRCSP